MDSAAARLSTETSAPLAKNSRRACHTAHSSTRTCTRQPPLSAAPFEAPVCGWLQVRFAGGGLDGGMTTSKGSGTASSPSPKWTPLGVRPSREGNSRIGRGCEAAARTGGAGVGGMGNGGGAGAGDGIEPGAGRADYNSSFGNRGGGGGGGAGGGAGAGITSRSGHGSEEDATLLLPGSGDLPVLDKRGAASAATYAAPASQPCAELPLVQQLQSSSRYPDLPDHSRQAPTAVLGEGSGYGNYGDAASHAALPPPLPPLDVRCALDGSVVFLTGVAADRESWRGMAGGLEGVADRLEGVADRLSHL